MKANELRLGNFIETPVNGITKIKWIKYGKDWCKPILLTEEWLLKFGFEKIVFDSEETGYGTEYHLTVKGHGGFIIEYMDDFSCCILGHIDDIGIAPNLKEFKHVHQLQNLYFALTGEELKPNDNEK